MSGMHFFDERSMRRISDYVRRHESQQPGLMGTRFPQIPGVELTAFRVVSDLSQEAIDDGTAVHGREVLCNFAADAQPGLQDLADGCLGSVGGACNGIVSCFPCDVTVTLVDTEQIAGPLGTQWTFSWSGDFYINNVDPVKCGWEWATRYVPTSANAAGVRLELGNALGFAGVGGCQLMLLRDVNRFGESDPGGVNSTYTRREVPNCNKIVFRGGYGGLGEDGGVEPDQFTDPLWGRPYRSLYELTWTCTDAQIAAGQALLESMLPACVFDRLARENAATVGRWTVDLSLFGGSPDPGSIILAKNIGGRWYAIGGRNTRVVGDKAAGSDPYRLDVDGCDRRQVPYVYTTQAVGADVDTGATHVVTWQHQTRKYVAVRFEECAGHPNETLNPYKCPCCFPCDTLPLCVSFPSCPFADFCGDTVRGAYPAWSGLNLTYTPKCKSEWDDTGKDCAYWSDVLTNGDCDCSGVWAQYCVDDANGTNGRKWVAEYFCRDNSTGTITTSTTEFADWICACGDVDGQLPGSGPRYTGTLTVAGCCCDDCSGTPPDCTCEPPATLYLDITGCECWEVTAEPLTYNGGTGCWESASDPATCIVTASLCCVEGQWTLTLTQNNAECSNPVVTAASGSCDPFSLTFSATLDSSCCPPSGGTLTITVSE